MEFCQLDRILHAGIVTLLQCSDGHIDWTHHLGRAQERRAQWKADLLLAV
jgi:hypothetical protein